MQVEIARALLDGQLVEADMTARHPERFLELVFPIFQRLVRTGIDQIETGALEDALRDAHGSHGFIHRMAATQFGQRLFAQRLHAQRDPIDPGGAKALETVDLDAGGIGFERDLGMTLDGPVPGDGIDDLAGGQGLISEGVPPPKNTDCTTRPGVSSAAWAISRS
jgi:hypothetical protein